MLVSLKRKKLTSTTPWSCALNFFILELRDSAAVVLLSFFPALCVLLVAQAVLLTGFHFRTLSLTAMPHTQLLHGIATVLLHMEAVVVITA